MACLMVRVSHLVMHASSFVRYPCKGHEMGCLLLLLKHNTGGDKRYEKGGDGDHGEVSLVEMPKLFEVTHIFCGAATFDKV